MKYLSSIKNPELKRLRILSQKSRERKKQFLFVIEGLRELKKALAGGCLLKLQSKLLPHAKASIVSSGKLLFVNVGANIHKIK